MGEKTEFIIIGAAIVDVSAWPVGEDVFLTGSVPAGHIAMHTGGDAMNEASVLAALGSSVRLVTKIGKDPAGEFIQKQCRRSGIDTSFFVEDSEVETGINIVLVDSAGERHFITAPDGSLRKLCPEDVCDQALLRGGYLCFASIFVSPAFGNRELAELFVRAKKNGLILCADMTKRKNGETLGDMAECLSLLDYLFSNYEEAKLLTGLEDPDEIADAILGCGVGCAVIKTGSGGCLVRTPSQRYRIPACPDAECLDTTGAGDTFAACFLYAHSQGMSLPDCGKFANAGASICIEQIGATGEIKSREQVWERYLRY